MALPVVPIDARGSRLAPRPRRCVGPACALVTGLAARGTVRAEGVSAAAASVQALPFRRDTADVSFPVAGLAMLLLLFGVAVSVWWQASRRGLRPWQSLLGGRTLLPIRSMQDATRIVESLRLDMSGRLHVIEWRGEQILVAVNGASPAVVLARRDVTALGKEAMP